MNRNFNQLTKTIALSLILAIISGFNNPSNSQTPTPVPVEEIPCPQNLDLNQLRTTLNQRYGIFNQSLSELFTLFILRRYPINITIDTINTQDQINKLGDIYRCVLQEQDNANLGTLEQRIAIRQTITEISAILRPAENGFTEEFKTLPISNQVKVAIGFIDEQGDPRDDAPSGKDAIDLLTERLTDLNTKLSSQINSLELSSTHPLPDVNRPTSELTNLNVTMTGVGAVLFVVVLGLLLNMQKGIDKLKKDLQKKQDKLDGSNQLIGDKYAETRVTQLEARVTQLEGLPQSFVDNPSSEIGVHSQITRNDLPLAPLNVSSSSGHFERNTRASEKNGIGVSETRESFEKRWSGLVAPIVLEPASNYNFLIINDRELIPKPGSKVTETKLNTIDGLFEYQNFRSGAPFQVIQPAIVSVIPGDRWQVTQKGVLHFE